MELTIDCIKYIIIFLITHNNVLKTITARHDYGKEQKQAKNRQSDTGVIAFSRHDSDIYACMVVRDYRSTGNIRIR